MSIKHTTLAALFALVMMFAGSAMLWVVAAHRGGAAYPRHAFPGMCLRQTYVASGFPSIDHQRFE